MTIKIIILSSLALIVLVGVYYLVKAILKLRKLNKQQETQELKKKGRKKPWQKTILPPNTYAYRKK